MSWELLFPPVTWNSTNRIYPVQITLELIDYFYISYFNKTRKIKSNYVKSCGILLCNV